MAFSLGPYIGVCSERGAVWKGGGRGDSRKVERSAGLYVSITYLFSLFLDSFHFCRVGFFTFHHLFSFFLFSLAETHVIIMK